MRNPGHSSRHLQTCIRQATVDCHSVVEFGCGFGDKLMQCAAPTKIGVDAHRPYLERCPPDIIRMRGDMLEVVETFEPESVDAVLLVDAIEHLGMESARLFVHDCQAIAKKRVIAFVPEGNHPQTKDVFEMGGDHWQTHRSTWRVQNLAEFGFDVALWNDYHHDPAKDSGAMFAVWDRVKSPTDNPPLVSICMAVQNAPASFEMVLRSIDEQQTSFPFEIVVVDDGSNDFCNAVCAKHRARYFRLDGKPYYGNPGPARNEAALHAQGSILVHQSADVMHQPGALDTLVRDMNCGEMRFANVVDSVSGTVYSGSTNQRHLFFLGAVCRDEFFAVGGNDEDFVYPGYEDNWLAECLVHGRGLKPVYMDEAKAVHISHGRPGWLDGLYVEASKLLQDKMAKGVFRARKSRLWQA